MGRKTHEKYIEELSIKNPTLKVLERYIDAKTKILHQCTICGYIWKPAPYNVYNNGSGCPVCSHKCIGNPPEYKNSIWASEYKDYFASYMTEWQMKSYMPNSLKKIELSCPKCNHVKKITVSDLLHYGFGCPYCSDGVSYPNKFARAFVEQLPVLNIQNEYSPEWCIINNGRCRYDIYFDFNNQGYIIEMDGGLGHGIKGYKNRIDKEGRFKDDEKDRLAKEHDIDVIRIDCRISEKEYIKQSILNSKLKDLFDLQNIDWDFCNERATSSNVFEASNLWNKGLSVKTISEILDVYTNTTANYLKQANKLGLCDYSKEESQKRGYKESSKTKMGHFVSKETCEKISRSKKGKKTKGDAYNARKVIRLCDGKIYDYLTGAADDNHMHRATMIKYCKSHNGYMYYDEWILK